jgi:hypothetical protein
MLKKRILIYVTKNANWRKLVAVWTLVKNYFVLGIWEFPERKAVTPENRLKERGLQAVFVCSPC